MMNSNSSSLKLSLIALTLTIAATCGVSAWGQGSETTAAAGNVTETGLPDDWTSHRLIFSNPGTEEDAIRNGTHDKWLRITNDPRYIIQQLKRSQPAGRRAEQDVTQAAESESKKNTKAKAPAKEKIKKDWNEAMGTATAPSNVVYPAKWSFNTGTASCANDFVIYPTGQAGASSKASIIAYYNMYTSGCSGTVPLTDWAYNTGGTVALAPVFSLNGNQIAFIQTSSSAASLVLLKYPLTPPGTGTLTNPIVPNAATTASAYYTGMGCATPCMYKIALSGTTTPNDTQSNPYYDYNTDSLYVGDSVGKLHKFSPVFNGAPAEVTSSWPVQLNNGSADTNQAASPVYDPTSGYVFVGTTSITTSTGGVLYSVGTGNQGTTTGTIHAYSGELDELYGILDAPLVDSTAGTVYTFSGENQSGKTAVYQFPTTFTTGATPGVATLGTGGTGSSAYQFAGTFDNVYYTSSTGSNPSGNLYVCGTVLGAPLYQIAIVNNSMSTVTTGPSLSPSNYYGRCSPITEFYNTSLPQSTTATGTVTISTNPGGGSSWSSGQKVTIGATIYTFVTGTPGAANEVEEYTSSGSGSNNETRTAENLEAVVNANSAECYSNGCVHSGQTANASATATQSGNVVTLTSNTSGSAGDFTLSTASSDFMVSGGNNGTSSAGTDYLFLSVLAGTQTSCTQSQSNGCVMAFDVTYPSNFSSSLTADGEQNISAPATASPTGGIIVDNGVSTPAGTSQIYFETQSTSGTSPCSGICVVQSSQTSP